MDGQFCGCYIILKARTPLFEYLPGKILFVEYNHLTLVAVISIISISTFVGNVGLDYNCRRQLYQTTVKVDVIFKFEFLTYIH